MFECILLEVTKFTGYRVDEPISYAHIVQSNIPETSRVNINALLTLVHKSAFRLLKAQYMYTVMQGTLGPQHYNKIINQKIIE